MKTYKKQIGVTLVRIGDEILIKKKFKKKSPCIKAEFSAGIGSFGDKPWIMEILIKDTEEKENISGFI